MKQKIKKYYSFTLIELLLVTVILGLIMPMMVGIYSFLIRSNKEIIARQNVIQQGYELLEKLNILMQDYTVDYEEYFNRQVVGCVEGGGTGKFFERNVGLSGYCTEFTAYGNENSTKKRLNGVDINTGYHHIYHCSSKNPGLNNFSHRIVRDSQCGRRGKNQSFGQYAALFTDVNDPHIDEDDKDLGHPVNGEVQAIEDSENIQELYLISHDGKSRLFFRRKLTNQNSGYTQYRIQMLRLRGFDAGQKHNFDELSQGSYDGQIDTWTCDSSMGFIGHGSGVGGAYSDYHLPSDADDCRIDLTYGSTSIFAWNLDISPVDDPDLYWSDLDHQINPYMKILLVNGIYFPEIFSKSLVGSSVMDFKVPIQTTINMKDFYRE